MIPGTRVVHATKEGLTGVVREYNGGQNAVFSGVDMDDAIGPIPTVLVEWGSAGEKGSSWVPLEDVIALEMEDAVKDREWFSCNVAEGSGTVRLGDMEIVGEVMQSEVHINAAPEKTAQIIVVLLDPVTRGVEEGTQTFEHHATLGNPEA